MSIDSTGIYSLCQRSLQPMPKFRYKYAENKLFLCQDELQLTVVFHSKSRPDDQDNLDHQDFFIILQQYWPGHFHSQYLYIL